MQGGAWSGSVLTLSRLVAVLWSRQCPSSQEATQIVSRLHTACGGLDAKPSGMSDHVSCSRNWVSIFLLTQQCSFKIPPCCILQCMYAIGQISTDVWFMTVKPRPVYHCPVKALQLTPSELQLTEPKAIVKKKNEYWFCFHLPKRWQEIYKSTTVIISVQISKVLVNEQEFTIHLFFFFFPHKKKKDYLLQPSSKERNFHWLFNELMAAFSL